MGQQGQKMKHIQDLPISTQISVRLQVDFEGQVSVSFEPHNPTWRVVIDADAIKSFNSVLSEKLAGSNPKDPNTGGFLREFSERWIDEMWSSGLALIENVSEKEMSGESLYKPWSYKEQK